MNDSSIKFDDIAAMSQAAYVLLIMIFVPFPFATDRKLAKLPWATFLLIAANFIIFFVFVFPYSGSSHAADFFASWGLIPGSPALIKLVTYMFVHVSVPHLFWNCLFLWLFGPSVEDALGHVPYLAFYFVGGIVAALVHRAIVLLFAGSTDALSAPLVGASGAISAVIGLYALRYYRSKLRMLWSCGAFLQLPVGFFEAPAIYAIALWLLENLVGAVYALTQPDRSGIAYWAHIGGFIFGMTLAEIAGMVRLGMREYLFADAAIANERGDSAVRAALKNFELLLKHNPDDTEVHSALAQLVQQSVGDRASAMLPVVSEAYSMLLSHSLAAGSSDQRAEWLDEFKGIKAENLVGTSTLMGLARQSLKADDRQLAEWFYLKVVGRFPGTSAAQCAVLELAAARLDQSDSPSSAVNLLTSSIVGSYSGDKHRSASLMGSWRERTKLLFRR